MSTANDVELLIITIVLSVYFISNIFLVVFIIKLVNKMRLIASKAESAINSVEAAAEHIKHFSEASKGKFPLLSILKKFYNMSNKEKP